MAYTAITDPTNDREKSVHFLHSFCFIENDIEICPVSQFVVTSVKLGNQNGSKCNADTEDKEPIDDDPGPTV